LSFYSDFFELLLSKFELRLKHLFFFIFILFASQNISAQNSYLQIKSDDTTENKIIDSLSYSQKHVNTKSLLDEVANFSQKLMTNGFLESKHEAAQKVNDSTFLFKYQLGRRNKFIHIYIGTNAEVLNLEKDTLKLLISETENFMNNTLLQLEKKGYSLAKLQLTNFKSKNNELYADLNLQAEKIRTLDDIVINGYDKFPAIHNKNIKLPYRKKIFNQ